MAPCRYGENMRISTPPGSLFIASTAQAVTDKTGGPWPCNTRYGTIDGQLVKQSPNAQTVKGVFGEGEEYGVQTGAACPDPRSVA